MLKNVFQIGKTSSFIYRELYQSLKQSLKQAFFYLYSNVCNKTPMILANTDRDILYRNLPRAANSTAINKLIGGPTRQTTL